MLRGLITRRALSSLVQVQQTKSEYAIVQMNRPPVNSLNTALIQELTQTIQSLEKDPTCRGMILASTSAPKIFCAGLDILEMYQPTKESLDEFWRSLQNLYMTLYPSSLITLAAIDGHSPAGGCFLALCCDERFMSKGNIGLNETRLGIVAPSWFQDVLIQTIGHRQAEKMLGLGLQYDASTAAAIGLIDVHCTTESALDTAQKRMTEWLKIPDRARQLISLQIGRLCRERLHALRARHAEGRGRLPQRVHGQA